MVNRPTIIDVAKLAGLSKTTVPWVINDDTRKVSDEIVTRIRQAIVELSASTTPFPTPCVPTEPILSC